MFLRKIVLAGCLLINGSAAVADEAMVVPTIVEPWWQVAGDPDLGPWTTEAQQPVDFGVWQAADGTWQLWSCIRKTNCGGKTRLFYAWEGKTLTDKNWKPVGIAMTADVKYGETLGGLQAPHVLTKDGIYYMFYGDWHNICMARSDNGKRFERSLDARGRPQLFSEDINDFGNTRDAMLLKVGAMYHCYYTAFPDHKGAVYCRTSADLRRWSPSKIVSRGGSSGDNPTSAECPHVVYHEPSGYFYLFRTQRYGQNAQTSVYRSKDPMDFGVDDDRCLVCRLPIAAPEIVQYQGQWYIAVLLPSLKGIQIAQLDWRVDPDWVRPGTLRGRSVFDFDDPARRRLWRCVEGNVEPIFTTSTRSNFSAPSRYFIGTAESARRPGTSHLGRRPDGCDQVARFPGGC